MSMMVAIVGARERSSVKVPGLSNLSDDERQQIAQSDKPLVNMIIANLEKKFGTSLSVVSFGCDDGVGILVKDRCTKTEPQVQFAENIWYFHGEGRSKEAYQKYYTARNAAIFEIADIFILLVNRRKASMLEDIIHRIEDAAKKDPPEHRPFVAIDEYNKLVKTNMDLTGYFEVGANGLVVLPEID